MSTTRDIDVIMKKRHSNDDILELYPKTKSKNIEMSDKTSLDEFITTQNNKNAKYDASIKKLDTIDVGAQKNQNAYSFVKVGQKTLQSVTSKDTLELSAGDNAIVYISGNKIIFDAKESEKVYASRISDGIIRSTDYIKLDEIEPGANRYIHPKSSAIPNTYVTVSTDETGHVIAGTTDPLPINKGGTGVSSKEAIKQLLDIREVLTSVVENSRDVVESGAIYNELKKKANNEHGNHVPNNTNTPPDRLTFLKEGNVWAKIPSADTVYEGVVKKVDEFNENTKLKSDVATAKAVYNLVTSIQNSLQTAITTGDSTTLSSAKQFTTESINNLINGAPGALDTLKEIADWIDSHEDLYEQLLLDLATKANDSEMRTELNKKVDKVSGKGLSTNDLTNTLKTNYDSAYSHSLQAHSPSNAERNIIVGIKKNGVEISPDNERKVNIVVPTKVSDLSNDTGFITKHPSVTIQDFSSNTETLTNGGSFSVFNSLSRDSFGHVTAGNVKTFTLPSVGNGTVTIKQAGSTKGTFTMNQSSNTTIELTDNDTHYTSHLYVGASGGNANATSATSDPYLLCVDNTTNRNSVQLKAGSNMNISAVNGVVTFTSTDTNTWRGIQDNLTSDSATESLSAKQGKALKALIDGKANSSHGNHVPATQPANNAVFLRNDNTWQTVTPANIGAATSKHTHTKSEITDFPSSLPASDVYDWAKASSKPSYSWSEITGKPSTFVPSSHTHDIIKANYTGNGGSQAPSYISGGTVRFNMMNCFEGLTSLPTYADCILMDTYEGSDVPYVTGLGIIKSDKQPRAFIAVGAKGNTTTWAKQAELITTANIGSQSVSSASSATALTTSAGSATQPVYFSGGKPVACTYTLGKSVPSNAVFTDTNTWRPLGTTADTACAGNDSRLSNARPASDVYAWAKASSKPSYSWSEITDKPTIPSYSASGNVALSNNIFSLSQNCIFMGDLNDAVYTGYYKGYNMKNAPESDCWLFGFTISSDANNVRQIFWKFAGSNNLTYMNLNDRYERIKCNGEWGEWVNTSVRKDVPSNAIFTDTTYIPGRGISIDKDNYGQNRINFFDTCTGISDWNTADKTGFYIGYDAENSPTSGWFYGITIAQSTKTLRQVVWQFAVQGVTKTTYNKYEREKENGTWRDWVPSNTWRGIQDNLTSDSATESLSAKQGKSLKALIDGKVPLSGGTLTGNVSLTPSKNIILRPDNTSYTSGIGYDTSGNECIALWAKNSVTRLRWHAGIDMSDLSAGKMMGITTPDFEISKADGTAKGYIGGELILTGSTSGVSPYADKLKTPRTIFLDGDVVGSAEFDGSQNITISTTVNYAKTAGNADTVDGHHFHWSGQSGQPTWVWGGNDSTDMYVYNPSNFSVNYARTAGDSDKLDGYHGSSSQAANTYVLRDGNGYIWTNYINSNTSNNENPYISQIIVTNGEDNYYRKASLSHLKSSLGSMPPSSHTHNYMPWYSYTIDLSNTSTYNENTWYPVVGDAIPSTGLHRIKLNVQLNSGTQPSWSTHSSGFTCNLDVLVKACGWGVTNAESICLEHNCVFVKDNINPCSYSQMINSSRPVLWLRGGGTYLVQMDYSCSWSPKTSTYTDSSQSISPTTSYPELSINKSTIHAHLSGNASTASKLATARTIALTGSVTGSGSFDGSGNLSISTSTNHTHPWSEITGKPTIPSVGDGTVTIKQAGSTKGTFTMNQSGNTTIELTDNNTWRGIQDNLTSDSTSDSLSAKQGKALKALIDGKANSSHGNHVPSTQTANNAVFLRNDNTWQTVTPANIGAATSNHTHTKSQITDFPTSLPASDVYAWAKASSKPSYSWSEITGKPSTFPPESHTHNYLSTTGGTITGEIYFRTSNYAPNGGTIYPLSSEIYSPYNPDRLNGIGIYGNDESSYGYWTTGVILNICADSFMPAKTSSTTLGNSSHKWSTVWATKSTISTSDRNKKTDIESINKCSEPYINLFDEMDLVRYHFKDNDSDENGFSITNSDDRYHLGLIAQDLEKLLKMLGLTNNDFSAVCSEFFIPQGSPKHNICGGWISPEKDSKYSENTKLFKDDEEYEVYNEILERDIKSLKIDSYRKNIGYILLEDNSKLVDKQPDLILNSIYLKDSNGEMKQLEFDSTISHYSRHDENFENPLTSGEITENGEVICKYNDMYAGVLIKLKEPIDFTVYDKIIIDMDFVSEYRMFFIPDGEYHNANIKCDRARNDQLAYDYNLRYDEIHNLTTFALQETRKTVKAQEEKIKEQDKKIREQEERLAKLEKIVETLV